MYHPTTRVLTVLELLQSHRQMTGPELAGRLEVDIRTVRRYITMLQDLGIPVQARRGRAGAYRLRPGFKLPPLMFNEEEAMAVVLGLLVARRAGLTQAALATESALAKIGRVLPTPLREFAQALEETLVIALPEETVPPASELVLALSVAAQRNQQVLLGYRSWPGEETERVIDPYGLVFRAGRWYAVGYCHLRQGLRVFRLDRMTGAKLREERFVRPADIDLLAEVEQGIGRAPGVWQVEALLKMTLVEAQAKVPATIGQLEQRGDGVLFRSSVWRLGWLAMFLAELRCPVTVLQPPELREKLRELASHISAIANAPEPQQSRV
jgi:predicted DNA-binding transcriptional regulator YafY